MRDSLLGIVGTGVMGRGVAQIAALSGLDVVLFDARPGGAEAARADVGKTLARLAEKNKISLAQAEETLGHLAVAESLATLKDAAVVIEAIVEDLGAKAALFREIEAIVSPTTLLATNTSSLSVTSIAAACTHPERVGGFHFFNPVPLMKVVEVIAGARTAPWVVTTLTALAKRIGHTPVVAKDTPGFIVNHAGRGLGTEALRVVGEGVASFADVDTILRDGFGFRMGPFELLDLTGLDVSHPVMESIYRQFYEEPRFRPSPITAQRLTAGLLGRKSGEGFFSYGKVRPETEIEIEIEAKPPAVSEFKGRRLWVSGAEPRFAATWSAALTKLAGSAGVTLDGGARPSEDSVCVVFPCGSDATTTALAEGLDPRLTVAVDALCDPARHRTLMGTPVTLPESRAFMQALLCSDGVGVSVVHDSAGLVAQRVVATIVNIGCDIAQQRIATPQDIDLAVTLGLGYPRGPLGLGDAMGADVALRILMGLQTFYGDPRYRPSPWLKRRALLGVPLTTPEN